MCKYLQSVARATAIVTMGVELNRLLVILTWQSTGCFSVSELRLEC